MRPTYALLLAPMLLAACAVQPSAVPDPTGRADADMLRVLTAYKNTGAQPIPSLMVAQARQLTPGDAATLVAQQAGVPPKPVVARVTDISIPGADGKAR